MVLPAGDGLTLWEEFSRQKPGSRILLSSGYPSKERYKEIIEKQNLLFTGKPYELKRQANPTD